MLSNNGGSSSILLEDVDDYLAPSQACINPLFQPQEGEGEGAAAVPKPKEPKPAVVVPHRRRRVRRINRKITGENGNEHDNEDIRAPKLPSIPKPPADSVKASIADCLACSGCVTTAETVLLEQKHSLSSLRQRLEEKRGQPRAITLSPNAWADMCRYWNLPVPPPNGTADGLYRKFTTLLHQMLQANMVIDGNLPLQWTWLDEAREFVELYQGRTKQHSNNNTKNGQYAKPKTPLPTTALDADRTIHYLPNGTTEIRNNKSKESSPSPSIPLISGSCPALVCLVEKSLQHLVPYLSQAPSPMSRVGTHLKQQQQQQQQQYDSSSQAAQSVDHWAVMPCHDKKLEASRPDFLLNTTTASTQSSSSSQQQAVDLVITTQELIELVQEWREQQRASTSLTEESMIPMAAYLESLPAAEQRVICEPNELPSLLPSGSIPKQPVLMTTTTTTKSTKRSRGDDPGDGKEESMMQSTKHKQMAYSSGGHAAFIFQYAAKTLFGCSLEKVEWQPASSGPANTANGVVIKSARLARQQKKAQHFYQAQLFRHDDGENGKYYSQTPPKTNTKDGGSRPPPVLSFGIAHGMQTMQRALKQLDAGSSSSTTTSPMFHYLEAMACPYGCVNGGGAARTVTDASRETPTETRTRVQGTLTRLEVPSSFTAQPPLEDVVPKPSIERTRYHVVPPMQYAMGAAAGVKVQDIQW